MKLTVLRAIPPVLVVAIAAFMVSGIPRYKNAKHGVDYVVGEVVWLGFLVAALALVVLVGIAGYRYVTARRATAARVR